MEESLFQPEMVGRERELEKLTKRLDEALEGKGSTVFISGEAGIGKTRLVEELKTVSQSKGFHILSGHSMYESLTPYMPFLEALKSGGLEYLFAEEAPRVEGVYLVTDTGLLIKEVVRQETELNPDIFASMLKTVGDFVRKSLSLLDDSKDSGSLSRLSHGDSTILIEGGESANLAVVISGRENEFLIDGMRETVAKVHKFCGNALREWDGDDESVQGVDRLLQRLITSGKYDGVYYGSDDPSARRNLLFENVCLGLTRQTQASPILLCVEDLQWADPSTLALMHYVAREAPKCSLLITGTYRPEDLGTRMGETHQLVKALEMMEREDLYEKMELGRLKEKETAELLTSLIGQSGNRKELERHVHQETEGNPLFILELVELLVEEDILKQEAGIWKQVKNLSQVEIPSKVYEVVIRRLNHLDEDLREVLDMGSINGEEFTFDLLASVLDWDRMRLLRSLRSLEQNYRLIRPTNGNYRFDHVKIKEVLYGEMPPEIRSECHEKIADTIQVQNMDNLDMVAGDLAFHYLRCQNQKKALPHLIRAAETAKEQYANEEAIRFYTEALELEDDKQRRREVLESLGALLSLIGEYDKSIDFYERALELAKKKRKKAEIKVNIGLAYTVKGDYDDALRFCNEAYDSVKGEECKECVSALSQIGQVRYYMGEFDKSLESHREGLVIAEKIGNSQQQASCLDNIGIICQSRGDYEDALENFGKSLEIKGKSGDQSMFAGTLHNIGHAYYHKGEYDVALDYYERAVEISERTGHLRFLADHLNNIGNIHLGMGNLDEAHKFFEESLAMKTKIGDQEGIAGGLLNIGAVLKGRDDYIQALEYFKKSKSILERIGARWWLGESCGYIAEAYLGMGNLDKAKEFADLTLSLSEETGRKQDIGYAWNLFGNIYREQNMWRESKDSYVKSLDIFREIGLKFGEADACYEFGLMWKKKRDYVKAKQHLSLAIDIWKELKNERNMQKARDEYEAIDTENPSDSHGKT